MSEARKLLEQALHILQNGERAPGCGPWPNETWTEWVRRAENFLRSQPEINVHASDPEPRIVPVPVWPEGWIPR